tara:strand:+ start:1622 stop:2647 length:1026 start_codon:yes stop_codon:yes gene_type:complete
MILGIFLNLNFLLIWSIPIFVQGYIYHKTFLGDFCHYFYKCLDKLLSRYSSLIYSSSQHTDYCTSAFLAFSFVVLNLILYCSGKISTLVYVMNWVGIGGSSMGISYTFAHKEGHNPFLYRFKVNIFENWIGLIYGNVPYNFTTSHIHIHHALDGKKGDTFYLWDFPRNSVINFVKYTERVFLHMIGISSLMYFWRNNMRRQFFLLLRGCFIYWIIFPLCLYFLTTSFVVLFVVWLQPLLCMTVFLSLMNLGFHAFFEYDVNGKSDETVSTVKIIDSIDDYFGENDHYGHHYGSRGQCKSLFYRISILELAIYVIFDSFNELAKYSDIKSDVLRRRAECCEY